MKPRERAEKILIESGYFFSKPGSPGGNCPVEHVAQLKDGRSYYFRARGSVASIEIYPEWAEWPEDDLPREEPEGRYETSYRWPDAGWISPVKAARLIVKWLSFFYSDPCRRYDAVLRAERMKQQRALEESCERAKTEDLDSEEAK